MEFQRQLTDREAAIPAVVEALTRYEQRRAELGLGQVMLGTEVQTVPDQPIEQQVPPQVQQLG